MTRDARFIVRFVAAHAAFGFGLSAVFVAALVITDVAQLRALFSSGPTGWFAAGLLFFFIGLTFSSVQMGIAIMQMGQSGRPPRRGFRMIFRTGPVNRPVPIRPRATLTGTRSNFRS